MLTEPQTCPVWVFLRERVSVISGAVARFCGAKGVYPNRQRVSV